MARKRKKSRRSRHAAAGLTLGGIASRYGAAKRTYHQLGDALYRSKHHGKSIKSAGRRRKRTKHRRSR